jgi:hypothetical protein
MIVSKQILPLLTRITCVNANRAARSGVEVYRKPLVARLALLKDLHLRHSLPQTFEDFFGQFLFSTKPGSGTNTKTRSDQIPIFTPTPFTPKDFPSPPTAATTVTPTVGITSTPSLPPNRQSPTPSASVQHPTIAETRKGWTSAALPSTPSTWHDRQHGLGSNQHQQHQQQTWVPMSKPKGSWTATEPKKRA